MTARSTWLAIAVTTMLALLAAPAPARAARQRTAAFEQWTTHIRVLEITDILATDDEIWCATGEGGLMRLPRGGQAFEVMRRQPGEIGSNQLTSLARDRSGRLWVGTLGSGVSRLSEDRLRWTTVNPLDGLLGDTVNVVEAVGDRVWIGTTKGISLWNGREVSGSLPDGNTLSFDATFDRPIITGIAEVGDTLWLATRAGIGLATISSGLVDWRKVNTGITVLEIENMASDGRDVFAQSGGVIYRWRQDLARWRFEPGPGPANHLAEDHGRVLASGTNGISVWDRATESWIAQIGSPADSEPSIDASGVALAGLSDTLYIAGVQPWTRVGAPPGPPGNDITNVALQGSRVYVTTFLSGVGRLENGLWRHWPRVGCLSGCDTTFKNPGFAFALLVDTQGRKWVGCWSIALEEFDETQDPPLFIHHSEVVGGTPLSEQKHTWAKASVVDPSGHRWFGMDTPLKGEVGYEPIGVDRYDTNGALVGNYLNGTLIHSLAVSDNNRLWIGSDGQGLYAFPLPNGPPALMEATEVLEVRGIAAFGDSLWILTPGDLRRFNANATTTAQPLQTLEVPGGPDPFSTRPAATGPDGSIWIGTSKGMRVYRPNGTREDFNTTNSPLADDGVRSIAIDPNGVLWVASFSGLTRFDPAYTPPPDTGPANLSVKIYPNPAKLNGLGVEISLTGDALAYRGEIYDLGGRKVRTFNTVNGRVFWDGRDDRGELVRPGIYFVRVRSGAREGFSRVALVR